MAATIIFVVLEETNNSGSLATSCAEQSIGEKGQSVDWDFGADLPMESLKVFYGNGLAQMLRTRLTNRNQT